MMKSIHQNLVHEKRQVPPRRFNCYAQYEVPTETEWNQQCDRLLILNLTIPDTKLKTERQSAYKEVRHRLAAIFPYVDVLGGNHLVAIAGTLGLLPLWVRTEIEIHKGRSLKWLLTKYYPNKSVQSKIKVDDVISNVAATLKTRNTCDFPRRIVENIICKVLRRYMKNNTDELFYDILLPGQNLYSVLPNHVQVVSADGKSIRKTRGALLEMIPFGGSYISVLDLQKRLPNNWPGWELTVSSLGGTFLDGLFDTKRGEYPEFPFGLNEGNSRNCWLAQKFAATEKRLLS